MGNAIPIKARTITGARSSNRVICSIIQIRPFKLGPTEFLSEWFDFALNYLLFIKHSLHQYSHLPAFVWPSTNTGKSSSFFLPHLLQTLPSVFDIPMA